MRLFYNHSNDNVYVPYIVIDFTACSKNVLSKYPFVLSKVSKEGPEYDQVLLFNDKKEPISQQLENKIWNEIADMLTDFYEVARTERKDGKEFIIQLSPKPEDM